MKNIILFFAALILQGNFSIAQTPAWQWAKAGRGNAKAIISDNSGNIYVAGTISDSLIIEGKGKGKDGIFVAKYDPQGRSIWVQSYKGNFSLHGVNVDVHNNIYIAGDFSSDSLGEFYLKSQGLKDLFIAKLDNYGTILWAKAAGGKKTDDMYTGVGVDGEGSVFISGSYQDSISFDNIKLGPASGTAVYLAKYDTQGNVEWAKSYDGPAADQTLGVAADMDGNVYCTGIYDNNLTFGNVHLTSPGTAYFLVKHDKYGNIVWAQHVPGEVIGLSVAVDKQGSVSTTGLFSGTLNVANVQISAEDGYDAFLIKHDKDGKALWAKNCSGGADSDVDEGSFVATDASNNVYVCGAFASTGGFIRKYSPEGNLLWKREEPKSAKGRILKFDAVCVSANNGSAHVIGSFIGSVNFDNVNFTVADGNMVLAKLGIFPAQVSDISSGHNSLQLYPNPTQGSITVNCSAQYDAIAIVDVLGRVVHRQEVKTFVQEREINVSSLPPGVYILQLQGKANAQVKFIKEK